MIVRLNIISWKNIYLFEGQLGWTAEHRIHEILKCLIKGWRGLIFFKFTDKTSMKHHVKGKKNFSDEWINLFFTATVEFKLQVLCRVLMLIIILCWWCRGNSGFDKDAAHWLTASTGYFILEIIIKNCWLGVAINFNCLIRLYYRDV